MIKLFDHQLKALEQTKNFNRVAYYLDMGLGKTFVGSEKMIQLGGNINLVICQKSKVEDWRQHFLDNYWNVNVCDCTTKKGYDAFLHPTAPVDYHVGVINYDLIFRRPELQKMHIDTMMLDESSLIQNENSKRSKAILNLDSTNVILLSGTPTSGKYEKLWSQLHLLGWSISKDLYWGQYVETEFLEDQGYPIKVVTGYKNVERLKAKLRSHGAVFMKSEEVFDLPDQVFIDRRISTIRAYRKFRNDSIVTIEVPFWDERSYCDNEIEVTVGVKLVGDTTLTKMLYERMLCGMFNKNKLIEFKSIVESTEDRLIVFYNFDKELTAMKTVIEDMKRPISIVNGKHKDLTAYENEDDSIIFVQYQAGSMGLNLQKANKIIYFTPPISSEFYEQSKKRTHRIGQTNTCFYYRLICRNSIEEKIYDTLEMRRDYTDKLFEQDAQNNS